MPHSAVIVELSWIGEQMEASSEMMHTCFAHTQDKKSMLLGSTTTRSILSRLSMQVQRHLRNVAKPSECSDSMLAAERGGPFTHLDRSSEILGAVLSLLR